VTLLKDDGHELDIEKGVYAYWRKFGNRTRDDPTLFIKWEELDNPEAVIRLENDLATILERFPGMVLEVKMKDTQTIMEGHKMIADTNDYTMVNGPVNSVLKEHEIKEHVEEYAKLVYGIANYGHDEFLACEHFDHVKDFGDHYERLKPIIILSNTMLCDECYGRILRGEAKAVFESCRRLFKQCIGEDIFEELLFDLDECQRMRYRYDDEMDRDCVTNIKLCNRCENTRSTKHRN